MTYALRRQGIKSFYYPLWRFFVCLFLVLDVPNSHSLSLYRKCGKVFFRNSQKKGHTGLGFSFLSEQSLQIIEPIWMFFYCVVYICSHHCVSELYSIGKKSCVKEPQLWVFKWLMKHWSQLGIQFTRRVWLVWLSWTAQSLSIISVKCPSQPFSLLSNTYRNLLSIFAKL